MLFNNTLNQNLFITQKNLRNIRIFNILSQITYKELFNSYVINY